MLALFTALFWKLVVLGVLVVLFVLPGAEIAFVEGPLASTGAETDTLGPAAGRALRGEFSWAIA